MAGTPARRTTEALEWQRNREVVRLTKEILELQRDAGANAAAAVVAMGDRMRSIQASLAHGQWLSWVATAVPLSSRTIQSAMRLSSWAEQEPQELGRLEHLGPTKLYMLAPLPPERRRELTRRGVPLVIPGQERPKAIDVMTTVELGKVIGGLTTRPSPPKPIGKIVQGLRHRIAGLESVADELVRRRDEVEEEQADELVQELRAVLEQLEGAFGESA